MAHTTAVDNVSLVSGSQQPTGLTRAPTRNSRKSFFDADIFTKRSDGILVPNPTTIRAMMPALMPGRNESAVTHEQVFDLRRTLPFMDAYNEANPSAPIKLFDLIIAAIARVGHERPGMTRFVAGGRLYERKEHTVSFVVKRERADYAALRTVKFKVTPNEPFKSVVQRLRDGIGEERTDKGARPVEKEVKWFLKMPRLLLAAVVKLAKWLDYFGMFPKFMMENDPMFSSVFVTNVGSLGIDRVFHHLYEYGNIGLFCAVGLVKPEVVVGANRHPEVTDTVHLYWTFDERANDAHYCVESLQRVQAYVENPEMLVAEIDTEALADRLHRDRRDAQAARDVETAANL